MYSNSTSPDDPSHDALEQVLGVGMIVAGTVLFLVICMACVRSIYLAKKQNRSDYARMPSKDDGLELALLESLKDVNSDDDGTNGKRITLPPIVRGLPRFVPEEIAYEAKHASESNFLDPDGSMPNL